jgi:predicted nuclease of predicted toxin-antitoxin system
MLPKNSRSFLLDENVSRTLVSALQKAGYLVTNVYEVGLRGHPDTDIFAHAQTHEQTIITSDLDFSNILHYPPPHHGIIVLRLLNSTAIEDLIHEVLSALQTVVEEDFANTLIIVEPGRVRLRR